MSKRDTQEHEDRKRQPSHPGTKIVLLRSVHIVRIANLFRWQAPQPRIFPGSADKSVCILSRLWRLQAELLYA